MSTPQEVLDLYPVSRSTCQFNFVVADNVQMYDMRDGKILGEVLTLPWWLLTQRVEFYYYAEGVDVREMLDTLNMRTVLYTIVDVEGTRRLAASLFFGEENIVVVAPPRCFYNVLVNTEAAAEVRNSDFINIYIYRSRLIAHPPHPVRRGAGRQ